MHTPFRMLLRRIGLTAVPVSFVLAMQPGASVEAASGPCPGTYTTAVTCATTYFPYTGGAQTWTVPDGVTAATFDVLGAQGGGSSGGLGGEATATITVTPGQTLQINVGGAGGDRGGAGFNGGGGFGQDPSLPVTASPGRGGGGASDVRGGGFALSERLIVGGGGGGQGGDAFNAPAPPGGVGGGFRGGAGGGEGDPSRPEMGQRPGSGGTQTAGGRTPVFGSGNTAGALGVGGNGGGLISSPGGPGGGGGGGGYYGGGGGSGGGTKKISASANVDLGGGGGGGGSGFGPAGVVFHDGVQGGNGRVSVTYWPASSSAAATSTPTSVPAAPATPTPTPAASTPSTAARPDLAGARVQQSGGAAIYLVDDDGTLRYVPDPATYNNLFRDGNGIQQLASVAAITTGPALTSGAHLAIAQETMSSVYLIDNGYKRLVTSPAVMDKFYFNWNQVQRVPQSSLDALPDGAPLT